MDDIGGRQGTCVSAYGETTGGCGAGYEFADDGISCVYIDECAAMGAVRSFVPIQLGFYL